MKYCSNCSAKLSWTIPPGEDRHRFYCEQCQLIHYTNPKSVAGAIPIQDGKILLCRRAIEPRAGKWTIPAGYLENGETMEECARRESMEEACAVLDEVEPYSLLNITFINQLYFIYLARLANRDFRAGEESLEVKLFTPEEIPWDELAFQVVKKVLRLYCDDLPQGNFPFREVDITQPEHS